MELIDPFEIAPKLEGKYNQDMVRYAPKIDAEVVTRCKNCCHSFILGDVVLQYEKPYIYYRKNCRMCRCEELMGDYPNVVDDNFYCGYGEPNGLL